MGTETKLEAIWGETTDNDTWEGGKYGRDEVRWKKMLDKCNRVAKPLK